MQLRWLRLRYQFGLGRTPGDLRYRARECLSLARALIIPAVGLPLLIYVGVEATGKVGFTVSDVLWITLPLGGTCVILAFMIALAGFYQSALAARSDKIVPVSGQCFSLLSDSPFRIFAQVGYTIATARWYCMPVEWEPFLHADAVSMHMEACPATGYVARLDSIGFYEVDLLAEASPLDGPSALSVVSKPPSEIEAYIRSVRSHGWGVPPRKVLFGGIFFLVAGTAFTLVMLWSLYATLTSPFRKYETVENTIVTVGAVMLPTALYYFPLCFRGLRFIVAGRRGLQTMSESALEVEGTIASTYPKSDWASPGRYLSVYTELELDDASTIIFRIPGKLAHRVPLGGRVRIECLPTTEVVTNVTLLEPDVSE